MRQTLTPRRYQLMLQILLIFVTRNVNPPDAKNTLRLVWASASDAIFIFQEIEDALKHVLSHKEIKEIYKFYVEAIGVEASKLEPRTLKQLCRTMIRGHLCEKDHWLPSVINEMDIPVILKRFLNLDE